MSTPAETTNAGEQITLTSEDIAIRDKVWGGFVPICFTVCPEDAVLAASTNPLYVLAPRMCMLPVIALDEKYSRSLFRNISGAVSETWFEDKETQAPLRWYLPIGVLYDLYKATALTCEGPEVTPIWHVVVHHNGYPETLTHWVSSKNMSGSFIFAIKEAVFIKFGDQKVTNALTEADIKSITQMTLSVGGYTKDFRDLLDRFFATNAPKHIPTRVCRREGPFVQQYVEPQESLRDVCVKAFGEVDCEKDVLVHGISVPGDAKMAWLYAVFAYPDNFLYITVNK